MNSKWLAEWTKRHVLHLIKNEKTSWKLRFALIIIQFETISHWVKLIYLQCLAVSKAVNEIEAPVKAKHIRSINILKLSSRFWVTNSGWISTGIIIGTFQDRGCQTYWSIVLRVPIQSSPIIAWKFCHALHKVLREGHHNVLKDSLRHRDYIQEHGKLWVCLNLAMIYFCLENDWVTLSI